MSNSDPTGGLLLGIGAGLLVFYRGFRQFREYKLVSDTPRINIRSVPMGFVHVRGKAEPSTILTSPVSKTPCCFYRVEIEHWKREDRGGSWQHWCTDADGYKFYISDGTGRILVDAHSAEYDLPQVIERKVNSENPGSMLSSGGASDADLLSYVNTARVHSMLGTASTWLEKKLDQKLEQQPGSLDPRKEQGMLALKEFLHAIPDVQKTGNLRMEALERVMNASGPLADPEREARRQQALERLRMMGGVKAVPELQAELEPKPASGEFRLREYVILPGQEYFVSGTCSENRETQDSSDRNVILKGENEPTFLISSKPDVQVIGSGLRASSLKMVFGGAALTLVCLGILLVHLHMF